MATTFAASTIIRPRRPRAAEAPVQQVIAVTAEAVRQLANGLATALKTIREDPSLTVTADGAVAAKPKAELRRLFPELAPADLDTVHREAIAAAAAYTADRQTPKQFTAAVDALNTAIAARLGATRAAAPILA